MKKLFTNKLGILILLMIPIFRVFGQPTTFNKVLPPDGKVFITVEGIVQDADGYMWFTTRNGLYRYDGYQIISYNHNPLDANSLVTDSLTRICIDKTGKIWIGTMGYGLECFDPATGKFKHYNLDGFGGSWISSLLVDSEGILWVAADGLYRYIKETDSFVHYQNIPGDTTSLSNNYVNVIYEDKQGTIWVGTGAIWDSDKKSEEFGGLNRMNKKTGKFTRFMHDPDNPASMINNKVSAVFEDSKGTFWIGTAGDGLHTMDREKGTFVRHTYDPENPEKLSRPPFDNLSEEFKRIEFITFIKEDVTGAIWIATLHAGLNYYDPKTGKTTYLESSKYFNNDYDGGTPWQSYTSRDGVLWISSLTGNLYCIDPFLKQIPHYLTLSGPVYTFYEEPNGILWIGTGKELIRKDKNTGITKQFVIDINSSLADNNHIHIITEDMHGNVWIGSDGGLNLWNKKKENFINYKNDPKNHNSLSNNNVYAIHEDNDSNLWVGTARGLNLLNHKTGYFIQYYIDPSDTSLYKRNFITDIFQDKTGKLWVSALSGGGINLLNQDTKVFKNYLKGIDVLCIYEDTDGKLWIGADNGLYCYNQDIDNFVRYIDSNSSRFSNVITMVEDNSKNLWFITYDEIIRLNPQRNQTSFYGENYGINDNEFIYFLYRAYKGRQGELYFGNQTGYYSFKPEEFIRNHIPDIALTNFLLGDHPIKLGINGPLKENLLQIKEMRLNYNQNVFTFEFTAFDYSNPEGNQHFCMLENYDKDWRKSNSERRAYYFNIPPGKYVFRVKAMNGNGIWAEKKIDVIILPPWWRTWWAYCIYGILFIALVFSIDRIQRQRLLKAEKERNRERELAQAKEIEKAYTKLKATQAQLIQSEKMASLGELTAGIAHEIQNPLNFVNNFSELNKEMLMEMKDELKKGNLEEVESIADEVIGNEEKINHHGKRADAIVKGMLLHSRTSSGVKEPTDINALADEYLRLAYHGLRAKDKSFNADFKTDFDLNLPKINVIPQDIGRMLLNLINNAFYAVDKRAKEDPLTPKGEMKNAQTEYRPTVTISTASSKSPLGDLGVKISVKDNGEGIPSHIVDKIFQPFFTTKPTGQGTGLGLSLAYDIVKAHGGELKVETKEARPDDPVGRGEGSEFIILLPT